MPDNYFAKITLFFQTKWQYVLISLCLLSILPFIITCFYIHPFFDDYFFADTIARNGKINFIHNFYLTWTGRYSGIALLSLFNINIGITNIQYVLFALFIIASLFASFLYLIHVLLKEITTLSEQIIIALVGFTFYLVFIPELFSSFYWYCGSGYQWFLIFLLLNIALIINYFKSTKGWQFKAILILLNIFIAGFNEIILFTFELLYLGIVIHQYIQYKKIKTFWLLLLILFGIFSVLNLLSPGNLIRMNVSDSENSFIYSSIRAFYDFILFHFSYTFFKTPFLFILIICIPFTSKFVCSNVSVTKIFNIHPLYSMSLTFLIFYLHHAISLYGAGYSLQGRVFNLSILLFWLACIYNMMVIQKYFSERGVLNPIEFNHLIVKSVLMGIVLLFSFSDNNRLLWGDLFRELPAFNKQMNQRYTLIHKAKEQRQKTLQVPLIKALPKLYMFGETAKCQNYNFANDTKYLSEASGYFKILIIKEK